MSKQKERELFIPNTAKEALELLEEKFPDTIDVDPLETMWDYGSQAGIQRAIRHLKDTINAEFINEKDENVFDAGDSQD